MDPQKGEMTLIEIARSRGLSPWHLILRNEAELTLTS